MTDPTNPPAIVAFQQELADRLEANAANPELLDASTRFMRASTVPRYSYNFSWLGRPIIQYPQDMIAMQELVWRVRPDLIIETGIAHGGSLLLSASLLALLDISDAIEAGTVFDPRVSRRAVVGVDIDIRAHNRAAVEAHPMASRIRMIQGSSVDRDIVAQVRDLAGQHERIMVCLDSNHTHDHVLAELDAYAPLTSIDSYCVVFDTIIEDLPAGTYPERSWGPGNSPRSAIASYLETHPEFVIDTAIDHKLLISVSPGGYLRRVG
jgi:cephalosporin hydroxylase